MGSKVLALLDIWPQAYCKSELFLPDEPELRDAFSSPQHGEREECSLKLQQLPFPPAFSIFLTSSPPYWICQYLRVILQSSVIFSAYIALWFF